MALVITIPLWLLKVIKNWNHEAMSFLKKCFSRLVLCTFLLHISLNKTFLKFSKSDKVSSQFEFMLSDFPLEN